MIELQLNLFSIIYFLGAIQGLFLMVVFIVKKSKRYENLILASLMFVYSIFLLETGLILLPHSNFFAIVITIGVYITYTFGPLHYLYTWSMIHGSSALKAKQFVHFIPFLIIKLYIYAGFWSSGFSLYEFTKNPVLHYNGMIMWFIDTGLVVHGIVYMVMTLLMLKKYRTGIRNEFSYIEKINLNWLKNITLLTSITWGIILLVHIIEIFLPSFFSKDTLFNVIPISVSVFVYIMGYFGFTQSQISYDIGSKEEIKFSSEKYAKTKLDDKVADDYIEKLKSFMINEKPYLDPNITLPRLSESVGIPEHHLSQIINDRLHQNFFQFINSYRVNEVKEQLINPENQHLSILGIAFESGFNSKSSFNTIFKNMTQQTPSQYQKKAASFKLQAAS